MSKLHLVFGGRVKDPQHLDFIDPSALDVLIDTYQTKIGPRNGARVIAKAWIDPVYREWLLRDATAAIASLGYSGRQGEHMIVVENTPRRHNIVVCTLCSCYPWPVLGLPPVWYKSAPYRSRVVRDPRGVLAEEQRQRRQRLTRPGDRTRGTGGS